MSRLYLTERALDDLAEIERYSIATWDEQVAARYMEELDAALGRLASDFSLLRGRPDFEGRLRFYPAGKHVLISDILGESAYVLAVWHGSMDFIDRLPDLEPQLLREAELFAEQIERNLGRP